MAQILVKYGIWLKLAKNLGLGLTKKFRCATMILESSTIVQ